MSIRLIKVSKNLNVGISSLVEFLQKKGIEVEANPNVKIEDEHYEILLKEFGKHKHIRQEAIETREKLQRRDDKREIVAIEGYELPEEQPAKKRAKRETIETRVPEEMKPQFNVVGSIDLDTLTEKKGAPQKEEPAKPEPEAVKPVSEKKKPDTPAQEVPVQVEEEIPTKEKEQKKGKETEKEAVEKTKQEQEPIVADIPATTAETQVAIEAKVPSEEKVEQTAEPTPKRESPVKAEKKKTEKKKSKEQKVEEQATQVKAEKKAKKKTSKPDKQPVTEEQEDEVFRLRSSLPEPNIVVKGTIDLNAINDRTRPARKSRAQRRKERLEREQRAAGKKGKEEAVKQLKKEAIDDDRRSDADSDSRKKKRRRIRSSKVNIDKPGSYSQSTRGDRRGSLRRPLRAEVSDEDVQKQIKETLARLTERRSKRAAAKYRREKREATANRQREELKQQERESKVLQLTEFVTVNDLANMMDVPVTDVISTLMSIGVMVAINQRLDAETINIVADEYGFQTEFVSTDVIEAIAEEEDRPEDLLPRPPIVTVMGHVDHGKTSLLDNIRSTNVIAGEAGGITQHIGAYNVTLPSGRKITFLDTPGHEAFTAMRARGAKVTDVAIIIVAADDNVMPQTVEAINHAGAAGVPIVFAINKIDKPGANPEKIKEKLAEMNYLVEDWGGKYQSQDISAKKGIGIRELLEKVLLEADMLELKANPNRRASGSIIESSLDRGRGYVATVLIENGTLRQGDIVLAGSYFGRVRAMFNERNQRIEEARPAEPVVILGLNGAPQAGDTFNVMETEQEARSIANRREQLQREQSIRTQKMLTLDDIGRRIAIGNFQQLNIIVKGDVDGSVEALSDSLIQLSTQEIEVNVIHKAVGQISESDITLAAASDAIIIGFQVRPSLGARKEAEREGVEIRLYSIIYDAIEEVTAAMEGMLSPDIKEEITGNVEVLEVFKVSKVGTVAGCMVRDGKIKRSNQVRLIRDGIVIFTGEIDSLKRFKDDVREVASGYECGISIRNFNDIKVGDVIESFEEIEVKKTL
ncbi:MAG: translation initiation factor IF-2 [Bacteroidota bacterium]|jgi:translation initiation factor IF-2|nr:translation initiation factor IF-2 [Bacteroidota bacterium]HHU96904.1 translation initiation factor IF-2 [Petrimonas sp.]